MSWEKPLTAIGLTFVLIGIALILVPFIVKLVPTIEEERIPWILLYIYRSNGFFFATSPILIILGVIYLLWSILHH